MDVNIDVTVEAGPVRPLPVLPTSVDTTVLTGDGYLYGWSFREASGDLPSENEGSVTSPTAGQTIATITGLAAGTYLAQWQAGLAGTLAAADANNFSLVPSSGPATGSVNLAVAGNYQQEPVEVTVNAGGSVKVTAIALGTVGAVYSAQLTLIPQQATDAVVEVRDGNEPIGESSMGLNGVDTQMFGDPGMRIRNQIVVHVVTGTVTGTVYARFLKGKDLGWRE